MGVHDDSSGKKNAGMLKHFRNLVNETAAKQHFLRSLHKSGSTGSGQLQAAAEEAVAQAEEEPAAGKGKRGGMSQPDAALQ